MPGIYIPRAAQREDLLTFVDNGISRVRMGLKRIEDERAEAFSDVSTRHGDRALFTLVDGDLSRINESTAMIEEILRELRSISAQNLSVDVLPTDQKETQEILFTMIEVEISKVMASMSRIEESLANNMDLQPSSL